MLETLIVILLVLWLLGAFVTPLPAVGGLPCWGPPLVDAQCVPSDHEPVPPTQ